MEATEIIILLLIGQLGTTLAFFHYWRTNKGYSEFASEMLKHNANAIRMCRFLILKNKSLEGESLTRAEWIECAQLSREIKEG